MKTVKLYSTPTCPYCKLAKDYLSSKNIHYEDIDVTKDEKLVEEMVEKTGQTGVPVIDIDGQIILGFQRETIDGALGR